MATIIGGSYVTLGTFETSAHLDNGVTVVAAPPDGWGSPAVTLSAQQRPGQMGAWAGESFLVARPITLTGTIVAPTAELASTTLDDLIAAASLDETTLTVHEGSIARSCTVRRAGGVDAVWLNETAVNWSVALVALDPRKVGAPLTATTGLPVTSGGWSIPWSIPWDIPSTVNAGQVALINPGNIAGRVVIRLDGPLVAPMVTHVGAQKTLVFASSMTLGVGEWLEVDMDAMTVLANGTATRDAWVVSDEFFGFTPGVNVLSFSGTGTGTMTVTAYPSWC